MGIFSLASSLCKLGSSDWRNYNSRSLFSGSPNTRFQFLFQHSLVHHSIGNIIFCKLVFAKPCHVHILPWQQLLTFDNKNATMERKVSNFYLSKQPYQGFPPTK